MLSAILWGGLVAGTLDLLDAFIVFYFLRGVRPVRILHAIASGLLGKSAFRGGAGTAALGAFLHYFIAYSMATVYVAASVRVPLLNRNPVACGIGFGVLAYLAMNLIVLPLSKAASGPYTVGIIINGVLIHALGIGLPIAWFARHWENVLV